MKILRLDLFVLAVLAVLAACSSVGDGVTAEVTVTYPSPEADNEAATSSLHVWVLDGSLVEGFSCSNLVGGDVEPYHPRAIRHFPQSRVAGKGVGLFSIKNNGVPVFFGIGFLGRIPNCIRRRNDWPGPLWSRGAGTFDFRCSRG